MYSPAYLSPDFPTIPSHIVLAISGASGSPYALSLLRHLLLRKIRVSLLISDAAREVLRLESGLFLPSQTQRIAPFLLEQLQIAQIPAQQLQYYAQNDWLAPIASGSNCAEAMVICPCSMGTLAAIAHGLSDNVSERAADVMLKEQRKLIIVPRETPFSVIHLENMLKLGKMGVTILPASPGFYHQPQTIADMVDFVVARILRQLGMAQDIVRPWPEKYTTNT